MHDISTIENPEEGKRLLDNPDEVTKMNSQTMKVVKGQQLSPKGKLLSSRRKNFFKKLKETIKDVTLDPQPEEQLDNITVISAKVSTKKEGQVTMNKNKKKYRH